MEVGMRVSWGEAGGETTGMRHEEEKRRNFEGAYVGVERDIE